MEIPAALIDSVIKQCRLAWPEEACGILSGPPDAAGPQHMWAMENASDHPRYRYAMDEAAQLDMWKRIDTAGHKVFVIFHSHTAGDAEPSPEDMRYALDPDIRHLIVALPRADGPPSYAVWEILHQHSAIEVPVIVT
jgi:[CysO sulfur-carrier protein]-S-L-cysteine hydrolase